jgi:hypothetical protein
MATKQSTKTRRTGSSSRKSTSSKSSASKSRASKSRTSNAGSRSRNGRGDDEVERFRQAAEDALQQLDWTIGYLHGIRKTEISKALARNRSFIRRNLMGKAEEPLPAQQTEET